MKDNKLIAEFMGVNLINIDDIRDNKNPYISSADGYTKEDLQYHTSWDWLMPVVQKIMDVSFFNGEPEDFYVVRDFIPEISDTYKSVVEFINQYNNDES